MSVIHVDFNKSASALISAASKTIGSKQYLDIGVSMDLPSPASTASHAILEIFQDGVSLGSERVINVIPLEDNVFYGEVTANRFSLRFDGSFINGLPLTDDLIVRVRVVPNGRAHECSLIHLQILNRIQQI